MGSLQFEEDYPGWVLRGHRRYRMEWRGGRIGGSWVLFFGDQILAGPHEFIVARPVRDEERLAHQGEIDPDFYVVRLQGDEDLAQKPIGSWTCREIYQAFYEACLNHPRHRFPRRLVEVVFDREVVRDASDLAGV